MKQTLSDALKAIIIGSITIFIVTTFALFVAAQMSAQQEETLPDRGWHQNPHCSPRGSKVSVRCGCLGMVAQVQEAVIKRCWGMDDPPRNVPEALIPREVLECLERENQQHCQIVARYTSVNESMFGITVKRPDHECKTSCKPENCGCSDEGNQCAKHGETELY